MSSDEPAETDASPPPPRHTSETDAAEDGERSEQDRIDADPATRAAEGGGNTLRVAVIGCSHGELDRIYWLCEQLQKEQGDKPFDLVLCCGDFQSVRNSGDLAHLHVPPSHLQLGTFHEYYKGSKVAPVPTLFIGGNHEASNYLQELPYGGWVAPNIYYAGYANVLHFGGLRIAAWSGIYKGMDYSKGHYETPPFPNRGDKISVYHVRSIEAFRLGLLRHGVSGGNAVDVLMTHDWPNGITDYGNKELLLRIKPYFREDIEANRLGNPASMQLIQWLRPRYHFAGHLHVGWAAMVSHDVDENEQPADPTRFLALDKPIPGRHFLQVLDIPIPADAPHKERSFAYDPEWLAVLKATNEMSKCSEKIFSLPTGAEATRLADVVRNLEEAERKPTPVPHYSDAFKRTGRIQKPTDPVRAQQPECYYKNPQTTAFCEQYSLHDINQELCDRAGPSNVGLAAWLTENDGDDDQSPPLNQDEDPAFDEIKDGQDFMVLDKNPVSEESKNSYLEDWAPPQWKPESDQDEGETSTKRAKLADVE